MWYRVVVDDEAVEQVAAMPGGLLADYASAVDAVAAKPWDGEPIHAGNPNAEVRRRLFGPFGAGQLVYLVLDSVREVHVLRVIWVELPDD